VSFTPFSATALILIWRPAALRGADALLHLGELAPAGDLAELRVIQRIDRDIDALHAMGGEFRGIFGELRAVGGEGEFLECPRLQMAAEAFDQRHDALADQRLAAGEAELLHALLDEGGAEAVQLLKGEQVLLGQEGHVLGHAVDAAEVAAVRHRHAEVADMAAERVDQGWLLRHPLYLAIHIAPTAAMPKATPKNSPEISPTRPGSSSCA
jgi:hypothetical protein